MSEIEEPKRPFPIGARVAYLPRGENGVTEYGTVSAYSSSGEYVYVDFDGEHGSQAVAPWRLSRQLEPPAPPEQSRAEPNPEGAAIVAFTTGIIAGTLALPNSPLRADVYSPDINDGLATMRVRTRGGIELRITIEEIA